MTDQPYFPANPGDLITAEAWNQLQLAVKQDIANQVKTAIDQIKQSGVSRADNADKFDTKSPTDWTNILDQRYALKAHDHEGLAAYRRYIKEFTDKQTECLLRHDLHRYPLVDVYELADIVVESNLSKSLPTSEQHRYDGCKLLFYATHADADRLDLWVRVGRDRVPLGITFEQVLLELNIQYDDNRSIEDLINDMADAFMKDPNDEIGHCTTPWIDDSSERARTVGELKRNGLWDNLYIALRPRKCGKGADAVQPDQGAATVTCQVEVRQANYQTVYIATPGLAAANSPLDLMILLRS